MGDIPVSSTTVMDKEYLVLLGETIFLYNMFECTLIDIVDQYVDGFRRDYYLIYRYNPKDVLRAFAQLLEGKLEQNPERLNELRKIVDSFPQAIDIRSAVAHGHPSTDSRDPVVRNRQVLSCQTGDLAPRGNRRFAPTNRYDDRQLTYAVLLEACEELERSCCFARCVFNRIRSDRSQELHETE